MTGVVGRSRAPRSRLRALLGLVAMAVAGVVAGRVVVLVLDGRGPETAGPPRATPAAAAGDLPGSTTSASPARAAKGVRVLRTWDADRASAYARGDAAALRRLYVPGSGAGVRDVRLLEAYVDRGLVVRGLTTQVLALRVRSQEPGRLVVEVTDRVVGGRAVAAHRSRQHGQVSVALPRDAPSTRVVALARSDGRWRVASVEDR